MADKKPKDITDLLDSKELLSLEKKFDSYHKHEESKENEAVLHHLNRSWDDLYKNLSDDMIKTVGGVTKKLDVKHEDKLLDLAGKHLISYLEQATAKMSKEHHVQFKETEEYIKKKGLKGQKLLDAVEGFYNQHIGGGGGRRGENESPIGGIIKTAISQKLTLGEFFAAFKGLQEDHVGGALRQNSNYHMNKHFGQVDPVVARMYARKHLLPDYDANIEDHEQFSHLSTNNIYNMWKGFRHADWGKSKQKDYGVKYAPKTHAQAHEAYEKKTKK
jgi:hypothetical protein